MEWTRSETLVLAMHNCTQCRGAGLRLSAKGAPAPCNCVFRAIFRICYDRFIRCTEQERYVSRVSQEAHLGKSRPSSWGRKDEEYIADFCLVSRRTLTASEDKIFRYHFLLGADWKLCARKLGIDRGTFFHAVYRIEQKLGRVFRELEPYPAVSARRILSRPVADRTGAGHHGAADPWGGAPGSSGISPTGRQDRIVTASLPAVRKEIEQESGAFRAQHSFFNDGPVIEYLRVGQAEFAAHAAEA